MSESKKYFQFGLTHNFACNYLPEQQERLVVVTNSEDITNENYQRLLMAGFRRSGNQVYRPHCIDCNSCESIRLPVHQFKPSKSQKRIISTNKDLTIKISLEADERYFDLYQRYINTVHQDGSMFPANKEQYKGFIFNELIDQLFIEIYHGKQLVSVAVCDNLPNSLSALYTFYDPDHSKRSLGKYSILTQIQVAKSLNKNYLYLGYQIDDCQKMNYKKSYYPHERLIQDQWIHINKS